MDLSAPINLLFLCLCAPAALLPYYNECADRGGDCMRPHQCPPNYRLTSSLVQCTENTICCLNGAKKLQHGKQKDYVAQYMLPQHRVRHNHSRLSYRPKVLYLRPENVSSNSSETSSSWDYSYDLVGEEPKIVNIELLNNSLDNTIPTYTKVQTTSSATNEDDANIVFPNRNEESDDDRIHYIQKLYQKYAMDFKKYNSVKSLDSLPKRKLKYAVGHKSAKHCKLYEKYTADETLYAIPLLPSLFPVMMQKNHCSKPLPLIVGGMDATRGEFPHMAALGYDRGEWIDFLCGGSLISERYVLTAAHCGHTKWGPPIIVRLGTRNLITDVGQNLDVEKVIIHPDYHEPSCYNDIALIRIAPGLQVSSSLRPACLPSLETQAGNPGNFLTATGWGRTGYGLFSSPNLQKVSLEVMDNRTCDERFLGGRKSERLPSGIQSSMLCAAGYLDSSHDTCQGDSGGPLQTPTSHSKCMYEIVGITSFGKLCGTGLPAIYTRVSTYIQWIEDIVWPS